jgi:hypothetical protein
MNTAIAQNAPRVGSARLWTGRVLSALPILALGMSGAMKLSHAPDFVQKWTDNFGFRESSLTPIGLLELLVMITYAVPRTRVFGAILVTGYLGGATTAHVRIGEPFVIPVLLGIFAWLGVWLTEPRLQALTPVRAPR